MTWFTQMIATSAAASVAITGLLIWISKNWFLERLKGSIQHEYTRQLELHKAQLQLSINEKLEALKSDLRNQEARFAGDLRLREAEIVALREGALTGSTNRQGLLYKRTMEAIDALWREIGNLASFKTVCGYIALTQIENAQKEAVKNPNMRRMFEAINKGLDDKKFSHLPHNERPYLSELAWAYFSAYSAILASSFMISKALEVGANDAKELIDFVKVKALVKAVLPHHADYIEQSSGTTFFYLLEELEEKLLAELRKILSGEAADQASITQAANIMSAVDKVTAGMRASPPNSTQ